MLEGGLRSPSRKQRGGGRMSLACDSRGGAVFLTEKSSKCSGFCMCHPARASRHKASDTETVLSRRSVGDGPDILFPVPPHSLRPRGSALTLGVGDTEGIEMSMIGSSDSWFHATHFSSPDAVRALLSKACLHSRPEHNRRVAQTRAGDPGCVPHVLTGAVRESVVDTWSLVYTARDNFAQARGRRRRRR